MYLRPFIQYFITTSLREEKLLDLAESLEEAQTFGDKDNPGHVDDINKLSDTFLLKKSFDDSTKFGDTASFKSLFYYKTSTIDGRGFKEINTFVIEKYLAYCDIRLNVINQGKILLPIQPGMIFIICVVDLIYALQQSEATLKVESNKAIISISLDKDRVEIFKRAMLYGDGTCARAFRRLLLCSQEKFRGISPKGALTARKWRYPESKNHIKFIQDDIIEDVLSLTWDF